MAQRLRFLLDTNVLIPLQDSYQVLETNLANFVRLANVGGHQLLYHPATVADFERDADDRRKARNLQRIAQYPALDKRRQCDQARLPEAVFRSLGCAAVVLVECSSKVVLRRLAERGDNSWAEAEVDAFALAEADHAASICASLAVPLITLHAPTPDEFESVLARLPVSR